MNTRAYTLAAFALACVALTALTALACDRKAVPPRVDADVVAPAITPAASTDEVDASHAGPAPSPTIGVNGGTVQADGVAIVVPPGALSDVRTFGIERVTGAALADWPRGTQTGFVFTPANERFRVPIIIKLPHAQEQGEVVCQNRPGERLLFEFEAVPTTKRFRVNVSELPQRCAVYSPEHVRALKAARQRETAQIDKTNKAFRWELKGKVCDPHVLVRSNAGRDLREPAGIAGCPAGMAPIPSRAGACVDRWEAHVVELLDDGTEHTWSPYFNPGAIAIRAKSAPGAVPQGYISQVQAGVACKAAGKRLCKDDEWVAACRGSKKTRYPYGDDEKRGTCNDGRAQHPAMQYLESHDLSVFAKLEHPCISQVADSLLPTGTKTACVNPDGVFDIVGNLHEWTADPSGHFRGGYYVDTTLNGKGCDYVTTAHEARYWDYSTGFRCCADSPKAP